jgi:hypothetical protein
MHACDRWGHKRITPAYLPIEAFAFSASCEEAMPILRT